MIEGRIMKISEVTVWFGTVNINYKDNEYYLSTNDPKTLKHKPPMELFLRTYASLGEALQYISNNDNAHRAQTESSP